jgi:hypothetical protein
MRGKGIKPYKTALAEAIEQTKKLDLLIDPTRTQNRIIGQLNT